MNVAIRLVKDYDFDGEGESIGVDSIGNTHTFWKSSGQMDVPLDIALKLEKEDPQRYEFVDRVLAETLKKELGLVKQTSVDEPAPTLAFFEEMVKDELNDWAAKRDYNLNPAKQRRGEMITDLCRQIKERTGVDVK